jgi:hypothetical protein
MASINIYILGHKINPLTTTTKALSSKIDSFN